MYTLEMRVDSSLCSTSLMEQLSLALLCDTSMTLSPYHTHTDTHMRPNHSFLTKSLAVIVMSIPSTWASRKRLALFAGDMIYLQHESFHQKIPKQREQCLRGQPPPQPSITDTAINGEQTIIRLTPIISLQHPLISPSLLALFGQI